MYLKQMAMMATLGLILTVGALTTIYPQHAFATLPPEASSHASDPGQGGDHGQAPSQAGGGGTCPPERGIPCR